MSNWRIKAILFLLLTASFSGCASQNDQSTTSAVKNDDKTGTTNPKAWRLSAADADSAEPAIASGKDGVFAVWIEHKINKEADLIFQKFDLNGQPAAERVRVNPQEGQAKSWRGDPPTVKVGLDGTIYVGWTAKVEGEQGSATTLYLSVSRDGGRVFESPVKVNDDAAPASHGMHSLAIDDSGRVYFAWLDERYLNVRKAQLSLKENSNNAYRFEKAAFFHHKEPENKPEPNAELFFAVSDDNGKSFSPNKRLTENACPCCKTTLLATPDGRLYASWRQVLTGDFRHIVVASSTDQGKNFSTPVIVSDDKWQISACPVSGASLMNAGNTLKVAWFTAGEAGKQGLYIAESADNGKTFSPRSLINESAISGTPVFINDNSAANKIIWEDNGKIMTAELQKNQNAENKQETGSGETISAVNAGGHLFISYVKKENEKRVVWLSLM